MTLFSNLEGEMNKDVTHLGNLRMLICCRLQVAHE